MGIINTHDNQIKFYYSSETSIGKQTLGYVTSSEKKVLAIDISKTNVPASHWGEIAANLEIPVAELIATNHPNFTNTYGSSEIDLNDHDWLRVLEKHPETLKHPVAIVGKKFYFIKSPSKFKELMENDSIGKEKPY